MSRPEPGGDHGQVDELSIVSVNVAQPAVLLHHPGGDVISGIAKQPVETPALGLTRLNLALTGLQPTRCRLPVRQKWPPYDRDRL